MVADRGNRQRAQVHVDQEFHAAGSSDFQKLRLAKKDVLEYVVWWARRFRLPTGWKFPLARRQQAADGIDQLRRTERLRQKRAPFHVVMRVGAAREQQNRDGRVSLLHPPA